MKKITLTLALMFSFFAGLAQLKGSGKTITQDFNYQNFDKVYFEDVDGKLEVAIGQTWSIKVTIDDNLAPLLSFKENKSEGELTLFFKGNKNNRMYLEDTHVNIKITMPEASVIRNDSNASLMVTGVTGRYFRLENLSNANTKVVGTVDELDLKNTSNGNANLSELQAKKATITCRGNGNATVNVSDEIIATVSGNGNVVNKGKAAFDARSSRSGNGNLLK